MEETSLALTINNCPICNHIARNDITEFYYVNNKNIKELQTWILGRFEVEWSEDLLNLHFEDHIKQFYSQKDILAIKQIALLKHRASTVSENSNKVQLIMQMAWERMIKIPNEVEDPDERRKNTKEYCELAKTFQSFHNKNLELMVLGKSEEEQMQQMKEYIKSVLDTAQLALEPYPEAQKIISDFIHNGIG